MTEIDWRTLKLFDLSKARVRIAMKDQSVLPALIEVIDEDWVFTIYVAVVGVEEVRRGKVMGESTREVFESHSGTGGGRREERDRSTARGSFRVGEAGRKKKGGERSLVKVLPVGTCGKSGQVVGNSWFSLNLKKLNFGLVGTEMASVTMAGGDKAFSNENGRAFERKAQSLPKSSPLTDAKVGCNLKSPVEVGPRNRRKVGFITK